MELSNNENYKYLFTETVIKEIVARDDYHTKEVIKDYVMKKYPKENIRIDFLGKKIVDEIIELGIIAYQKNIVGEWDEVQKENDELEHDLITKQNMYIDQLQNKIRELESRLEIQTICGYTVEDVIKILSAIDIEREYDIKFTMDNLQKFIKLYQKEQTKMLKDTLSKINCEWPPGGKEIKIQPFNNSGVKDFRKKEDKNE